MSGLSPRVEFNKEKRQLLYWISQLNQESNYEDINLDIPDLAVMFQTMGFKLESFVKSDELILTEDLRIEITCPLSRMKTVLVKQNSTCKCPNEKQVDEGCFWSMTGCGPSSQTNINSSHSSLLPTISKSKVAIINSLFIKIIGIISSNDRPEKERHSTSLDESVILRRQRSLDALKSKETQNDVQEGMKRRLSWEVDPKTSPPQYTSSPVPELCKSLSQVSINSGNVNIVLKKLETMKTLLEETIKITAGTTTFVKTNIEPRRVSDIKPIENNYPILLPSPRKKITPKRFLASAEKQPTPVPGNIPVRSKIPSAISTASPKTPRKGTPAPPFRPTKSKMIDSKIQGSLKIKTAKPLTSVLKGSQPGVSGISKRKFGGKFGVGGDKKTSSSEDH